MDDQTTLRQTLERIAWYLNYHEGKTVPVEQIAEETGLDWGTIYNAAYTLERLHRINPAVTVSSDGITMRKQSERLDDLFSDPETAMAVYIFNHAQTTKGDIMDPVEHDVLSRAFEDHEEIVHQLEQHGAVEETDTGVQLTPQGVQLAGSTRSRLTNGVSKTDSE